MRGLVVLLVGGEGAGRPLPLPEQVSNLLLDTGLTPLWVQPLRPDLVARLRNPEGPEPAVFRIAQAGIAIAAFDPFFETPNWRERLRFGTLDNRRLIKATKVVAKRLGIRAGRRRKSSGLELALTVDGDEARAVLDRLGLPREAVLRAATDLLKQVKVSEPILAEIPSGRLRARLDVIEHRGSPAVRKTFLPQFAAYARREIEARRTLSGLVPAIDPALESGPNYLVIPRYRAPRLPGPDGLRLHPISHARAALAIMRDLYDAEYSMLDGNSHSILYAPDGTPRLIDLEYLHRYDVRPASFDRSFDIQGPPRDANIPGAHIAASFTERWRPWIGVGYEDLVSAGAVKLAGRRILFVATRRLPRLVHVRVRNFLRAARDVTIGLVLSLRGRPTYLRP